MEGAGNSESVAPDQDLFRIGEVSRLTSTKPFVLRYWETEFPMLQPVKSPSGHRLYRRQDIETVFLIKRLLYDEGFTIAGARRHLQEQSSGTDGGTVAGNSPGSNGEPQPHSLSLNRKTLLDLRDSLRSLLTLLEDE